jgi:hypothetical protein
MNHSCFVCIETPQPTSFRLIFVSRIWMILHSAFLRRLEQFQQDSITKKIASNSHRPCLQDEEYP